MVAITHPDALRPARRPILRPAARPAPSAVYVRRRLAVLGLLALLLASALLLVDVVGGALAGDEPASPLPVAEVSVVVQPGDTVWSLAAELAEGSDPRPIVDAITEANGGAALEAGQRLVLRMP
jgi:hypothetical protein